MVRAATLWEPISEPPKPSTLATMSILPSSGAASRARPERLEGPLRAWTDDPSLKAPDSAALRNVPDLGSAGQGWANPPPPIRERAVTRPSYAGGGQIPLKGISRA